MLEKYQPLEATDVCLERAAVQSVESQQTAIRFLQSENEQSWE